MDGCAYASDIGAIPYLSIDPDADLWYEEDQCSLEAANGALSPTLWMAAGSSSTAAGRSKRNGYCDPSAAGNRRRLGRYHPPTYALTPATCAGQYGMDLAESEGSSVDEPHLVVVWPRGVLAHSAARCLALRGDNVDGVYPGIPFIGYARCGLCDALHALRPSAQPYMYR